MIRFRVAVVMLTLVQSAAYGFTLEDYRATGVDMPPEATVPRDAVVIDESGQSRNFRELITNPSVLVFADYTCRTLCGPIVAFVGSALEQSGLSPAQFQLLVVGLDPKDTTADAIRTRRSHLGSNSP